jgi:hypothetical protein
MTNDIQAAAERRRSNPGWKGMIYPYAGALDDAVKLADAYLEEHDETPLSGNYMLSRGFTWDEPNREWMLVTDKRCITISGQALGRCVVCVDNAFVVVIFNVGEFVRLMDILGVTLRPAG